MCQTRSIDHRVIDETVLLRRRSRSVNLNALKAERSMINPMPPARATDLRMAELRRLLIMDSTQERAYDDLTRMAAQACDAPIALISLTDDHRTWFKSRIGLQAEQAPAENGFCEATIAHPNALRIVRDARVDPYFCAHPYVVNPPHIRFYAGAPLVTSRGIAVGTLCVVDYVPRDLLPEQLDQLSFLAEQVVTLLEARASVDIAA